jgi:dipeptidyl aminopeptidase/acylaminoacyl peptidase
MALACLLAAAPPAADAAAAQAAHAPAPWTPELAFKVKRVTLVRVSPDGTRVAYVVGTAVMEGEKSEWLSQVHVARSDGTGAFQLTRHEKASTSPEWSPDGQWIAFLSARGKDKDGKDARTNVWRVRVDGGEAEAVTGEKADVAAFRWSPDGRSIAFVMPDPKTDAEEKADKEKRDARVVDAAPKQIRLRVVGVDPGPDGARPVRTLTTGDLSVGNLGGPGAFDWSPDGKWIAFAHQPTPHIDDWTKADVSVVEVATGAVRPLCATRATEGSPAFSPDGQWVALILGADPPQWRRRFRVHVVPAAGGTPRPLADTKDHQPDVLGWSADGKRIFVGETRGTVNRLSALPVDGGPPVDLGAADMMVDTPAVNESRTHVGFASQAPDRAPEAYASRLEPFAPVQVSRVQDLPPLDHGKSEVLTWKAPDGRAIEGLLTYPVGHQPGRKAPLLVIVHGGPAGVFVRSYTGTPGPYTVAGFANHGYAVLRCNIRGSSGYGFDFRNANYRDWGGADYQDILSGVDSLIAKGIADPDRLGIMGWSYGGYMTSWVITQTRRFKAASVGAGVTNLMSFTGTADIPSFIPDYFGGEFWTDGGLDTWRAHSAMFHVKNVATPTLIQHGEADLRVPISQGYELYNALRRQGVATQMVVYPRQPHGIQEPKLLLDALTRNLDWFDRYVLGKGGAGGR